MAGVDTVASSLLDKLYDMVAKLCLDYFRHLLVSLRIESHSGIFRFKIGTPDKSELASAQTAAIFAVKNSQGAEIALPFVDTLGIVAQSGLDLANLPRAVLQD